MDQTAQESAPEYEVLQNVPTTSESYVPYHNNMYPEAYPPPQQQSQQQDYSYDLSPVTETPSNYEEARADEIIDEDEEEPENSQNPRYTPPIMKPRKLGVLLDQERFLPIANVARIMKTRCEDGTKISKDAKECVQECLSEFISFLTAEAAELCHQAKRKTITADDLLTAMEGLGFDNYAEPMRITLAKYRQANKLTGPIHKEHATYVRPDHFANDPPFRPLFFETENGTRCTETRYFNIESGIVPTDAELDAEWQHLQEPEVVQTRNPIPQAIVPPNNSLPSYQPPPGAPSQTTPIAQPGTLPITALEQQTQMQIYVDASTKQHYAAMDTENGVQLYPINISSSAPITLTNLESPVNSNPSTSQGGASYMYLPDGDRPNEETNENQHEHQQQSQQQQQQQQPNNQY